MKLILTILALNYSTIVFGQLYSTYTLEGVTKSTGGPTMGKSQIFLYPDNKFIIVREVYTDKNKLTKPIASDSSSGQWSVEGKILKLDFLPESISANKKYDTYLVRKSSLKRTTYKDERAIFKASGVLLKNDNLK
jgi:hypothetical protein